jgi:dienelactone hydrolase
MELFRITYRIKTGRKADIMLKEIEDRPKTAIVLLHEIYGINNHILSMHKKFKNEGYDVYCIDLLNNKTFDYEESENAYSYFMEKVGFDKAKQIVLNYINSIRNCYEKIFLIGYSVGATIAWLCSEENELLNGVAGYYGSRIRDYIYIVPAVETLLLFPLKEKEFNIESLIEELKEKEKVRVFKFGGLHGFADSYSNYYDSKEKELSEKILCEFICE